MVAIDWPGGDIEISYRLRETGLYGETPFVDEWKPLPPRLHAMATLTRNVPARRFAVATREVTATEFRRFVAETGYRPVRPERFMPGNDGPGDPCRARRRPRRRRLGPALRLPTEDEWQIAASRGLLERATPLVWNLTESEHRDGRSRFVILKGGWRTPRRPLRLVRRIRPHATRTLGQARPLRRRPPALPQYRLPPRGRSVRMRKPGFPRARSVFSLSGIWSGRRDSNPRP